MFKLLTAAFLFMASTSSFGATVCSDLVEKLDTFSFGDKVVQTFDRGPEAAKIMTVTNVVIKNNRRLFELNNGLWYSRKHIGRPVAEFDGVRSGEDILYTDARRDQEFRMAVLVVLDNGLALLSDGIWTSTKHLARPVTVLNGIGLGESVFEVFSGTRQMVMAISAKGQFRLSDGNWYSATYVRKTN